MPRTARKQCESNMYHIISRGVGRQIIFESDKDRSVLLHKFQQSFADFSIDPIAWCFMDNHIHLLLHANLENISCAMGIALASYARYFNNAHVRYGTLFQERFTSIPIESDSQVLETLRYIHLNPVKIGDRIDGAWSSYQEYLGKSSQGLNCETELIFNLLGDPRVFEEFHQTNAEHTSANTISGEPRRRLKEPDALNIAKTITAPYNLADLRSLPKPHRDEILSSLREAGLSVRQIAMLTSIGESIITRARHK